MPPNHKHLAATGAMINEPGGAQSQMGVAHFVISLFDAWHEAQVPFVILRNYQNLPNDTGNDLDVLVTQHDAAKAQEVLLEIAAETGYRLHNRAERAASSPISIYLHNTQSFRQIHVDLFTSLKWRDYPFISAIEVLKHRVSRGQFAIPHPVHEAIISMLGRLLYHGYVKHRYKSQIATAIATHRDMAQISLEEAFGASLANSIVDSAAQRDWTRIEAMAKSLRRSLIFRRIARTPIPTVLAAARNLVRLIDRMRHPTGLMVAVIGPDGSGKSAVAGAILRSVERTYGAKASLHVHWKPEVLPRGRAVKGPVTDPHAQPVRSKLTSLIYFMYHLCDFVLGSNFILRRCIVKNGLVVVERYYYDYFVDTRRFRMNIAPGIINIGYSVVMKPDLVVCLDAPADVIHHRKNELSLAETSRQRESYRLLTSKLQYGYIIDATQPLQEVTRTATSIILSHLSQRTKNRMLARNTEHGG